MSETTTAPKVKVTISEVKEMLKQGLDRKAIGQKFGLSWTQTKELFKNPKLKGLKVHRAIDPNFELVDDEVATEAAPAPATTVESAPVATEASVETAPAVEATAPAAETAPATAQEEPVTQSGW